MLFVSVIAWAVLKTVYTRLMLRLQKYIKAFTYITANGGKRLKYALTYTYIVQSIMKLTYVI